jgi:hypothetical protein
MGTSYYVDEILIIQLCRKAKCQASPNQEGAWHLFLCPNPRWDPRIQSITVEYNVLIHQKKRC